MHACLLASASISIINIRSWWLPLHPCIRLLKLQTTGWEPTLYAVTALHQTPTSIGTYGSTTFQVDKATKWQIYVTVHFGRRLAIEMLRDILRHYMEVLG